MDLFKSACFSCNNPFMLALPLIQSLPFRVWPSISKKRKIDFLGVVLFYEAINLSSENIFLNRV